jgi:hypothetical protein
MADYSVSPLDLLLASRQKEYVGLHVEQGVPVLDRDLNLLHDLIAATVREIVTSYIGNGSPAGADGFRIEALTPPLQDFRISAASDGSGRCLVGGLEVTIPAGGLTYTAQADLPALTTPTAGQPDPRPDTVYLDAFLVEVDATTDTDLRNDADVGVQTSVRLKPGWVVRVAEGSTAPPAAPPGHAFHVLATLARPRGNPAVTAAMITDRRQRELTVSTMELPTFVTPQFAPRIGAAGTKVRIFGTNFNIGAAVVRFGDVVAAGTAESPTLISTVVPRHVATEGAPLPVLISVENAGGRASADAPFTVLPVPAFADPGVQFEPTTGDVGTPVTVHGDNLNGENLEVKFGAGTANVVGTPTARQLRVEVPPGLVPPGSTSASVRISVSTDQGDATSDDEFLATQPAPAPAFAAAGPQFTPQSGAANDDVTLLGQNFNFGPRVFFDVGDTNREAPVIGQPTATQIKVKVPDGVTTGGVAKPVRITVRTAGGPVTSTQPFTVNG